MIQMTKQDCILCNGSGFVTPYLYPYRGQKKCGHRWSRGSFLERLNTTHDEMQEKTEEHARWQRALESEVVDEN